MRRKLLLAITSIALILGFSVPTANAESNVDITTYSNMTSTAEDFQNAFAKYSKIHERTGYLIFDVEKAKADGGSYDFIRTGELYNTMVIDYNVLSAKQNKNIPNSPYYGNFCGPFTTNMKAKPIDELDKACRTHDRCYGKHGWGNKQCDRDFVSILKRIMPRLRGKALDYAAAAIVYFN